MFAKYTEHRGNHSAGTLVLGFAAPPAYREALDSGRWIGFLGGFVLVAFWLRREPD